MLFCHHCGKEVREGNAFCVECGQRLTKFTPEERQKYINGLQNSIKEEQESQKEKKRKQEDVRSEARSQEVEARRQEAEQWFAKRPWTQWIIGIVIVVVIVAIFWPLLGRIFSRPAETPQIPSYEVIEISAGQLYQEYRNNEVAADLKYKGKMLKVTGIVRTVGEDILGNPYVVIVGDKNDWRGVQCLYPETQAYCGFR